MTTTATTEYEDYSEDSTIYNSYPTPCVYPDSFKPAELFTTAVFTLVFVLALIGNCLVVCVVQRYRCSRDGPCSFSLTDTFLLHLAASDLLLALTLPFYAVQWARGWVFGDLGCKIIGTIFSVNLYGGILLLACISFDRYLAIVHALTTGWHRQTCHAQVACGIIWVACLCLACLDVRYQKVVLLPQVGRNVCIPEFPLETNWHVTLPLFNLFLGFGLPLLVMLYCYIRIFRSLCHVTRRQKRKSLRLIVSLVSVFLLCWAPYNVFRLIDSLLLLGWLTEGCQLNKVLDIGILVSQSLGLTHCALNPLLYGFVGVKFRKELVSMWKRMLNSLGYLGMDGWGQNGRRRRGTGSLSTDSENTSYFSVMV